MEDDSQSEVAQLVVVRPDREIATMQRLPYFVGISSTTAGAQGLSMHLVVVPPGGHAEPHIHCGYETGICVLEGRVETRYGPGLRQAIIAEAGDFLFIPPGVPHQPFNLSMTMSARAVVARNRADEMEQVLPYEVGG
ncbi:cupin domain-containing protein [Paraburkholderia caribensis]|uniref:cupin domain-containing protein n=1 Tax=Paraburkholderia caribensis TaxID=75105 RepID=UPI0015918F80|nr:cupin domain-containing protein [Paraburkholderia caribensis]